MKYRQGYVSNSSSSSFIIIGGEDVIIPNWEYEMLTVPQDFGGHTDFGGEKLEHTDFGSRLNFAYMQALYGNEKQDALLSKALEAVEGHNNTWLGMLEHLLKDKMGVTSIKWELDPMEYDGFIDHSSCAGEGMNIEMYESMDNLEHFLFSPDSLISEDRD